MIELERSMGDTIMFDKILAYGVSIKSKLTINFDEHNTVSLDSERVTFRNISIAFDFKDSGGTIITNIIWLAKQ